MSYYNTTSLEGEDLAEARKNSRSQQEMVMEVFRESPDLRMTPWDVQRHLPFCPITSVRRAITDLTDAGELEKTSHKREGAYEAPNYTWRLPT